MEEVEIEFLKESNAIEREYSEEALEDAIISWEYAKKLKFGQPYNKSIKEILGIHKRLMKRLNPRIAGKIRKVQVGVMTRDGFKPANDYKEIMNELKELLNIVLYPYYLGEQYIREWHIQFEKIHPFEDGNGRTGRIIMNIQRLKIGLPLLIIHEGKEQQEYYKWFKDSYKKSVEDVKLL
jgi:Fic family protein